MCFFAIPVAEKTSSSAAHITKQKYVQDHALIEHDMNIDYARGPFPELSVFRAQPQEPKQKGVKEDRK